MSFTLNRRERFAMAAMQGMLANDDYIQRITDLWVANHGQDDIYDDFAKQSVEYADALIRVLDEK